MRLMLMLGEVIRRERVKRGWTQRELAVATGMAQANISMLEANRRPNPSAETLQRLASAFNITVDDLLQAANHSTDVFPAEELLAEGLESETVDDLAAKWRRATKAQRSELLRTAWELIRLTKEIKELQSFLEDYPKKPKL